MLNIVELINKLNERTNYDNPTGCWLWLGALNKTGYGEIQINYVMYRVHRLSAYIFLKLDITNEHEQANHKPECPNKNCWNWNHLYVGTHRDNMEDKPYDLRKTSRLGISHEGHPLERKEYCKWGHEMTEDNTYKFPHGGYIVHGCKTCRTEASKKQTIKRKQQRQNRKNKNQNTTEKKD